MSPIEEMAEPMEEMEHSGASSLRVQTPLSTSLPTPLKSPPPNEYADKIVSSFFTFKKISCRREGLAT